MRSSSGAQAGKHVLVEKPLARTDGRGAELMSRRGDADLRAHARAHVPLQPARSNKVRELIATGVARRRVLRHLVAHEPRQVPARRGHLRSRAARPVDPAVLAGPAGRRVVGVGHAASSRADVAGDGVHDAGFAAAPTANIQVSWLAPRKVRQMVVVGSRRMVVYDDTASDEPVRIYDRGMDFGRRRTTSASTAHVSHRRDGRPAWRPAEPLSLELRGLRPRHPYGRRAALRRRARARDRRRPRGGRDVRRPPWRAGRSAAPRPRYARRGRRLTSRAAIAAPASRRTRRRSWRRTKRRSSGSSIRGWRRSTAAA